MIEKFYYNVTGFIEAEAWLKSIGKWDELSAKKWHDSESTDGWILVREANRLWEEMRIND